jgi:hypothetical protein
METWRLIQENAMAEHRANMEAFKSVLAYIGAKYGCDWQHLGATPNYERMDVTEKVIFATCMERLEEAN